ncbi:MAG: hypothetical protein Q4C91_05610 [Eubacteriales bacterium]|nr:hypothetical protein [Eubacteriales bacterium]
MKKKINRIISSLLLILLLASSMAIPVSAAGQDADDVYKIGVVVYNPDSQEMKMFMNYYKDYLEEGFPVQFYFSGPTYTAEEENAFIEAVKAEGAQGIISFLGIDVQSTLEVCEENEMYYVLGSNFINDEDYEAVKDNPWFQGCIGPNPDSVYQTGQEMASYFLDKGAKSFLIMTGGASKGNSNHAGRTEGMLDTLKEQAGLVLDGEIAAIAASEENTVLTSEDGSISVTLCPDYTEDGGAGLSNLEAAFSNGSYDALMSAFHVSTYLDKIAAQEAAQGTNIMVGAVDSFTEENFEAFKEKDAFGNPPIDFVQGKYASMAGPAFALLYNAISGHPEVNSSDGTAVRLYQELWTADSREKYIELYGYTTGIYENAYSCADLMNVIKVFNDEASPEAIKELTEACTVEDVKARILSN